MYITTEDGIDITLFLEPLHLALPPLQLGFM